MKIILFVLLFSCGGYYAQAQTLDAALSEYAGTYNFPTGSFISSAKVTLDSNVLTVKSEQGSSPLEKVAKDTFSLTNYDGGMVYFFRNDQGKVAKIKVTVQDILLEGTKQGDTTSWINKNNDLHTKRQIQVK